MQVPLTIGVYHVPSTCWGCWPTQTVRQVGRPGLKQSVTSGIDGEVFKAGHFSLLCDFFPILGKDKITLYPLSPSNQMFSLEWLNLGHRVSGSSCNLFLKNRALKLGVVHAYNPSTWEAEAGYQEFQVSMGYTVRLYLKKKKNRSLGVIVSSSLTLALASCPEWPQEGPTWPIRQFRFGSFEDILGLPVQLSSLHQEDQRTGLSWGLLSLSTWWETHSQYFSTSYMGLYLSPWWQPPGGQQEAHAVSSTYRWRDRLRTVRGVSRAI
jgi:hypothetical protein